ncbi:LysM domain-containing protein [Acinetobacter marinus]|uniref:LysM domain-containing protein n=2 Tax=Acinetobacter marinus TaxID=281375 RepID=A0A1G6GU49_9GAMM|nr:LysM peptidoglycan-binding domain-containing protein [Acinetobacter marinus]SDB85560.1 LysM domain-containing protein [Acinetobacter marinus]
MLNATVMPWSSVVSRSFRLSIIATALASLGALTACSSTPQKSSVHKTSVADDELLDADSFDSLENLLYATDMRAVEGDRLLILRHGDVWKRMTVGFKMNLNVYNPRIEAQRSWFITRQPYLDRLSARASRYIYYTVKEAERRGIPTELALLPVIESSYDPAATSSAAAAGMWQFIPSTGKIYGLRQTDLYDGRRDVVESTRAAYEYLSSLYNQFGSWELALAAYNGGPGRVQQAINRNKAAGLSTDFWSLRLPTETMNYVPRFLAVAQIIKNPHQYGVSLPAIANRPHFREVNIPGAIDLNELSRISGVSRGELYALNPGHRGNYTDPYAPHRILIPNEVNASVDNKIAKMKTVSGYGGMWAGGAAPLPTLKSNTTTSSPSSVLVTRQPSQLQNSGALTTQVSRSNSASNNSTNNSSIKITSGSNTSTSNSQVTAAASPAFNKQSTPQGSNALATFASSAYVPSAPRLPVSITPSASVKQINAEPPISAAEKQIIVAEQAEQTATTTAQAAMQVERMAEPQPSEAEKQQVIAELEKIAPKGTEIVDPLDGKIRLTAIQSSQSIAEQTGQEVELNYAIPKAVAEAEIAANSADVARNRDKPIIETPNEVVVVQPKGKREIYTVQAGDTLAIIASRFGVSWRDIANWNQINADRPLYVGTKLYLYNVKPTATASQSTAKSKAPERYTVRAGDSLTGLANQYQLDLREVAAWNNLSPTSNLRIGQRITLVEPKNFNAKSQQNDADSTDLGKARNTATSSIKTVDYRVKRGEYLKQIADRYAMSTTELAAINPDLNPTSGLFVGQKIKVPADQLQAKTSNKATDNSTQSKSAESTPSKPDIQTMSYTVVAGDYLSSVATKHKISLADLAALNDLKTNSQIFIGQKLQVPAQEDTKKSSAKSNSSSKRPSTYQVQSGDTLIGVADKFDLYVKDLAAMNDIETNAMLYRGQVLKLDGDASISSGSSSNSASSSSSSTSKATDKAKAEPEDKVTSRYQGATDSYTVRSGESLTALANRYGISNTDLAGLNNISSRASLRVGQKLKVPKMTQSYQVQRGDSLIALARKYGISTDELAEMNNLKSNAQLQLGQRITVPNR